MPRTANQIAADFDALSVRDFDFNNVASNGWERLYRLCEELRQVDDVGACAKILFRTMERLDDADLGNPGPLVHTLEAMPGYQPFLTESLNRRPTRLAVWMVNRILNTNTTDASAWLNVLRDIEMHSDFSETTRAQARHFLEFQSKRSVT